MAYVRSLEGRLGSLDYVGNEPPALSSDPLLGEDSFDVDQRKWYSSPDRWYWSRLSHSKDHPWRLPLSLVEPPPTPTTREWDAKKERLQYQRAITAISNLNTPDWEIHEPNGEVARLRMSWAYGWTFVQNFPITFSLATLLSLWHDMHSARLTAAQAFTKLVLDAPVNVFVHPTRAADVASSMPTALAWFPEAYRLFRILYNIEYLRLLRKHGSHQALLEYVDSFGFEERTEAYSKIRREIEHARLTPLCHRKHAVEPHLVDLLLATRGTERGRPTSAVPAERGVAVWLDARFSWGRRRGKC
ncbi:hypothetical protein JCM10450v2_005215 [Rhodotorula kratochvilovae]